MSAGKELALFVFVDALGWEIVTRHPFLDDVWVTQQPLETVLGYSCTCDPTILTGAMPQDHGHFSFFLPDRRGTSPLRNLRWLSRLPSYLVDRGRVRRWLSRGVAASCGFDGYFQLYETPWEVLPHFDYSEKKDIYQPGGIIGGQPTIFDRLRREQIPFALSDWRRSEADNFRHMRHEVQSGEVQFAYLYLAGLDGILHAEGTESPRVVEHLRWYERELKQIIQTASQQYDDVRVYVFSDHGMTDVHQHLDLIKSIEALPLRFGRDYLAYYDSTMARFWFRSERAETQIRAALSAVSGGRPLSDHELERNGVLFPDRRYGELIFLCDPGVLICPSFMGRKPMKGMHGYDPCDRHSSASFQTNSKNGPVPERLDQMFDLMNWEAERINSRVQAKRISRDSKIDTIAASSLTEAVS